MSFPSTFELPTIDKLTNALTSAYFRHLLREELLPQAAENEESLSFCLIDLDFFKRHNDNHGHRCGDEILIAVAQTLRTTLPETAISSRYGGDEFAAILPNTRLDDAFSLLEEFRRRIQALKFAEWSDVQLTCSIGLAAFPMHGKNDVELVREADQALYLAKSSGRNKVSIPLQDNRMITKTNYYTAAQLERLAQLAKMVKRNESALLREALDDLLKKYNDRLGALPKN